jgi:hypothetical protein
MKKLVVIILSIISFFAVSASAEKPSRKDKVTVAKEPLLLEHFNSYSTMKKEQFQHNSHNSHYSHYSQFK